MYDRTVLFCCLNPAQKTGTFSSRPTGHSRPVSFGIARSFLYFAPLSHSGIVLSQLSNCGRTLFTILLGGKHKKERTFAAQVVGVSNPVCALSQSQREDSIRFLAECIWPSSFGRPTLGHVLKITGLTSSS